MAETKVKPTLLHGFLSFSLHYAKYLPKTNPIFGIFEKETTDPYVVVIVGDNKLLKSDIREKTRHPTWEQDFNAVPICSAEVNIVIQVVDKDVKTGDCLGSLNVPCRTLAQNKVVEGLHELAAPRSSREKTPVISFRLEYHPVDERHQSLEVDDVYFPVRKACNLSLFTGDGDVKSGKKKRCLYDIYHHIVTAKKFIYISSRLDPKFKLKYSQSEGLELGRLLIRKARAGVNVLLLLSDVDLDLNTIIVQDDSAISSNDIKKYFSGSSVKVVISKRTKSKLGYLKSQQAGTCYEHNQKFIVLDARDTKSKKRKIVGFLGGRSLTSSSSDPTDEILHCKVEGEAGYDLIRNFEERWMNDGPKSKNNCLSKIKREKYNGSDTGQWNVQIFRSLNEDGCNFLLSDSLQSDKGRLIDNSFQRALIHQIRRSKKFLYIESERFMGRCWKTITGYRNSHLIIMEIVSKICGKIFSGERYAVYIVLPLLLKGSTVSAEIKEMQYWQIQTMEMMYKMIAKAIEKRGPDDARVTDYLNFYTLGSRRKIPHRSEISESDENDHLPFQRSLHVISGFLLIVDDEYLMVGTGAISQTALSGKRNSELAVGAWQPRHTQDGLLTEPHPKGRVWKDRLLIWTKHIGVVSDTFRRPHRISCVRAVNKVANENWRLFICSDPQSETNSSLLKYPVAIQSNGQIVTRRDCKYIPDTKLRVLGLRRKFPGEKQTL